MRAYHNPNKTASFHVRMTPGEVTQLVSESRLALSLYYDATGRDLPALGVLAERLHAAQGRAAEGAKQ